MSQDPVDPLDPPPGNGTFLGALWTRNTGIMTLSPESNPQRVPIKSKAASPRLHDTLGSDCRLATVPVA